MIATYSVHNEALNSLREDISIFNKLPLAQWDFEHKLILEQTIEDIALFKETFKDELTSNEQFALLFIEQGAKLLQRRLNQFLEEDQEANARFQQSIDEYNAYYSFVF